MKAIPSRWQLGIISCVYASLLVYAAALIYQRHLLYVNHPEDVNAAGGMYAFGDEMLILYLYALFMIPTFFLVRLIAQNEAAFRICAKVILGIGLSAPACVAVLYLARAIGVDRLGDLCLWRLLRSPFVMVPMAFSRVLGRRHHEKRLISYALLIEVATFVVVMLLIVFAR